MESAGMREQSSYDHMLTSEYASLLAMEFNRNPVVDDEAAFDIYPPYAPTQSGMTLPLRPPIVTIMGHVDHGKTTLLDTLRSASVAKGEAGGITQHIGAFSVPVPSLSDSAEGPRTITFLDTPGHAAFSSMRARGASVTDIIVLVVAADDGVKPQTKEVIDLIKKDGEVGVVVAINKIDKPGIDLDRVHTELWAEGIQLESMQGDIPAVELSGLTGEGLDKLVETISALAEIRDIRSEVDGPLHGYVLESKMSKGHGATATVLLLRGSLTHSSHIISGTTWARARQMTDPTGKVVKVAGPGTAVTVSGWKELPQAGDEVLSGTESDVKKAVQNRIRKSQLNATLEDAEAINEQRRVEREKKELEERSETVAGVDHIDPMTDTRQKKPKELRLVIKGDVSGSVEAVAEAVHGIGNQHAVVKVVSTGVGDVTESDVMMAKASEGVILAFSVGVPKAPKMIAAQHSVHVYSSSIIYQIMDEVTTRIINLLPPVIETKVVGEATVLQLFDIMLKGRKTLKVAGCRVTNGLVEKSRLARVIRSGEAIHDGVLQTLRLFKKDVTEVKKGNECGMSFDSFEDLREGDLIQTYQTIEKPGKL
ncbi:initiation factor 2 [Rickenella mellea]|uniref:Translation initiation factor IF-2, mitochondrial n=1 Tax=Rickenella mellea TaxID=50990 RepID=A0A4Y7QJN0_9AGAM|nr:initiation factor 2 [Rickenella mellea]